MIARSASPAVYAMIREHEGLSLAAYCCPTGHWTIGYGSTSTVKRGMKITLEEAEGRLRRDIGECERVLSESLKIGLNQNQFDALVSFLFNLGPGTPGKRDGLIWLKNGRHSTLWRLLNAGDFNAAALEFDRWANGTDPKTGKLVKLPGLVRRRADERKLFCSTVGLA